MGTLIAFFKDFILSQPVKCAIPFRKMARLIGAQGFEVRRCSESLDAETAAFLKRLSGYIALLSRVLPWECKCLVQAFSGARILKANKIPYTLYLGLAKGKNDELLAHAWLTGAGQDICGFKTGRQFTQIECFGQAND